MRPATRAARWLLTALGMVVLGVSSLSGGEWRELLDGELSHWRMYLSFRHSVNYNGQPPVDASGRRIEPIGFDRNEAEVFTVKQEDGRWVLRVSGEIYGCVFTKEEFRNYRLRLKTKWGRAKWDPRKEKLKDSGILYHSVGEPGVEWWRSWMLSQEFQIMEGHMGDYWSQANSAVDIRAFLPEGAMNAVASERQPFRSFGAPPSIANLCLRSADHESPAGEWTELELICFEGRSLHIVNGNVVMVLRDSRTMTDGQAAPLTQGRIQLQSEAAEVFFTDVQIQEIEELPPEFARYFE